MKYNNLDDIFYLEDLFIVWQAEQAKEKEYKNDKGLTVQQLADKAGISKRTLEDIMRRDDVLMSNIIKIANAI